MKGFELDKDLNIYVHSHTPPIEYKDGAEEYLLNLFRGQKEIKSYSPELVKYVKDWATMYHLSPRRVNLLESVSEILDKEAHAGR